MTQFYVNMIKAKILTINDVPETRKAEVQALL